MFGSAFLRKIGLLRPSKAALTSETEFLREADEPPNLDELFGKLFSSLRRKKPLEGESPSQNPSPLEIHVSPLWWGVPLGLLVLLWLWKSVYVIGPSERGVVFFLGRFSGSEDSRSLSFKDTDAALSFIQPTLEATGSVESTLQASTAASAQAPLAPEDTAPPASEDPVSAPSGVLFPGAHFLVYPFYSVERVPAALQSKQIQGRMLTRDENLIMASVEIQYLIEDPVRYVLNVSDPDDVLTSALTSALRHVEGNTDMADSLTGSRPEIAKEVGERLQAYLNLYNGGLQVKKVNLQKSAPPQEVQESFDDVNRAREDAVRLRNKAQAYTNKVIPEARGQAARILAEAQSYAQKTLAGAQGEASRFNLVSSEFAKSPDILELRIREELKRKVYEGVPKVIADPGKNVLYLPLESLIKKTPKHLIAPEKQDKETQTAEPSNSGSSRTPRNAPLPSNPQDNSETP